MILNSNACRLKHRPHMLASPPACANILIRLIHKNANIRLKPVGST